MRERNLRLGATVFAVLLSLIIGSIGWAAQSAKVDVSGTWAFSVESAAGTSSPTVTFKQEGEKLTGHYSSQLMGEAPLTGSIKGQTIDFTVAADVQGTAISLK